MLKSYLLACVYDKLLLYNQEFLLRCDINLDYPVQSYFLITDISYESRNYLLYMIKNRTYIGNYDRYGIQIPNNHKPIIVIEKFNQAQEILQ